MQGKEALELLKNNVSDYLEAIKNNEPTIDKIEFMCVCFYPLYETIKQDLEILKWLKNSIISKKRIQSLRETANPIYEIILHIPQNILKEVLGNE